MTRALSALSAALAGLLFSISPALAAPAAMCDAQSCGNYGTTARFAPDVAACRLAAKEKRLVMLVHLSGRFEDEGLT